MKTEASGEASSEAQVKIEASGEASNEGQVKTEASGEASNEGQVKTEALVVECPAVRHRVFCPRSGLWFLRPKRHFP